MGDDQQTHDPGQPRMLSSFRAASSAFRAARGSTVRSMASIAIGSEDACVTHLSSSNKPALLYFTAAWCGPCQMVAPQIEKLSEDLAEDLDILKVDLDTNAELAGEHGITAVPTFILLKPEAGNWTEAGRVSGASIEQVATMVGRCAMD